MDRTARVGTSEMGHHNHNDSKLFSFFFAIPWTVNSHDNETIRKRSESIPQLFFSFFFESPVWWWWRKKEKLIWIVVPSTVCVRVSFSCVNSVKCKLYFPKLLFLFWTPRLMAGTLIAITLNWVECVDCTAGWVRAHCAFQSSVAACDCSPWKMAADRCHHFERARAITVRTKIL